MSKIVIVSNRLPIKIVEEGGTLNYLPSDGGLASGLGSIYRKGKNIWVGWPGTAVRDNQQESVARTLGKKNMVPVFLTATEIKEFYEGFSNETLWPNFHYFNEYTVYNPNLWNAYAKVNEKFGKALRPLVKKDDIIWIHDYQLLLLPEIVRREQSSATIGFFLHIPFPSFEMFRLLPWREPLLRGMLGSDFLGFHTYDDMRHFLSSVGRILGVSNHNGKVTYRNRLVAVDSLPMGIDFDKYAAQASHSQTINEEVQYRTSMGNLKFVLSIDRLDYSKGIPQRIRAFEMFLEKNRTWRGKVSLLMVVVPSRDMVPKYAQLKNEIDNSVGKVNGKFSTMNWTPIHYFYRSFPLHSLSAFYRIAHVAMVTPLRDGMNLVCKEFVASKIDEKGVLILSEMAGASKELSDSILVNPTDKIQLADSIHQALTMDESTQTKHMKIMRRTVSDYNIHHWVRLFFERLDFVKNAQENLKTRLIGPEDSEKIRDLFRKASKRLIILDYDGTLMGYNSNPQDTVPDKELKTTLRNLCADKRNQLVISSGRDRHTLEKWFHDLDITLVAEHGVWIKRIGSSFEMIARLNNEWKDEVLEVMESYVARTPGSFVEHKDYSLVWHYRKVEMGLGRERVHELMSHIKYLTSDKNLQVLQGNMVVEIKSAEVNKGRAVLLVMQEMPSDFILCCGDDVTDEDMFKVLPPQAVTIKVSGSSSQARFSLVSFKDVRKFLSQLSD